MGQAGTQWVDNPTPPPVQDMVPWARVKFEGDWEDWMSRSYCQSLFSPEHFSKVLRTLQNEQELRTMLYFLLYVMGFAGIPMGGQSILWTSRCYTASTLRAGWSIVPSLFSISVCLIWIKSLTNWRRESFSEPWIWFWENISRCFAGSTNQSILSRQGACGMRGWGSKTPATSKHQRHDWKRIRIDMMFRKFGTQICGRLSSLLRRRPLWSASSDGQIMQCHSVFLVAGLHISKGQVDQFLQESEVTRINTWVWRFALFISTHW